MAKRYSNVGDMLRDLLPEEGPQLAQDVEAEVAELSLSDSLTKLRLDANLKQTEVAERLDWQQPRVSKLENSPAEEIRMGDFVKFLGACGYKLDMMVLPESTELATRVKVLANMMGDALQELAKIGQADAEMEQHIRNFNTEVILNLGMILGRSMEPIGVNSDATQSSGRAVRLIPPQVKHSMPEEVEC